MSGFCEKKFRSMLISGTFTKAVMYLMLLSDSIIAGYFVGETGVAAINAITPVTAIVTFFGDLVSTGVGISLLSHQYPEKTARRAKLFVEEICLTILDKNQQAKKPVLIELSLFFDPDSVLVIERDSGELFDLTDPDSHLRGLSGFILSGLMEAHQEKAYLVTTGYNRNMIRFPKPAEKI